MLERLRDIHINLKDMPIKVLKGGIAASLGFGIGYVLDRLAIEPPKIPILTPQAISRPVDLINSTFGPSRIKTPYPEIVSQPLLIVNNERKTLFYESKNVEVEKIASAYIAGTKRIDPDNPVVETIRFNLIELPNGEYRIDLGDQTLREFSISKVNLAIQYEIPDSKNSTPSDFKSLIAIDLGQALSSDPLNKIEVTLEKIEKITLYGPNQVNIVLDREFIKQYPAQSEKLLDLFLTMARIYSLEKPG